MRSLLAASAMGRAPWGRKAAVGAGWSGPHDARVGCWRRRATGVLEKWPSPPPGPLDGGGTEPGLQACFRNAPSFLGCGAPRGADRAPARVCAGGLASCHRSALPGRAHADTVSVWVRGRFLGSLPAPRQGAACLGVPQGPPSCRGDGHRLNGRPTAAACPGPASAGLPEARKPKEARLVRDDGPLRGGPAASPSGR